MASKDARMKRNKARIQYRAAKMRVAKKHGFVDRRRRISTARDVAEMLEEAKA